MKNKILLSLPLILIFIGFPGVFGSEHNEITNFLGHTDGWAVIDNEAQKASMSFVGNGTINDPLWKLQTHVIIDSNQQIKVDLRGSANAETGKIKLTGFGKGENDVDFVVILRGNYASIENLENVYALDWSYAGIHWLYGQNDNQQIRLFQNGFLYAG